MTPKSVLLEGEAPENPVLSPNPDNLAADGGGGGGGGEVGSEVSWGHISRQLGPIPVSITLKKKSSQMSSSSLREAMFSALQSCFQVDQDKDLKIVISREGVRSGGTGLPCTLRVLLVFPVIGPGSLTTDTTVVTT